MQKSMWTSFFHDLPPEEAVELFAREGWTCLELSNEHGAALLGRGDPERTGAAFRRFCADAGVRVPQGHLKLWANIALPAGPARDGELDELRTWLDLFTGAGIGAAVLHPGEPAADGSVSAEQASALNVDALARLTSHAADGLVAICLENGPNAGSLLRLIDAVGAANLGICLDTGHLAVERHRDPGGGQSEYDFIAEAGERLRALHVADNDGSGDQHLLPHEGGAVDWHGVMRGLRDVGYDGPFNFEIPGETRCPLQERLTVLSRASEIAERLMAHPLSWPR